MKLFARLVTLAQLSRKRNRKTLALAKTINDSSKLNESQQQEARFQILYSLANQWDLEIYNKDLLWLQDKQFWDARSRFPIRPRQRPDRKFVVWNLAKLASSLPGDTAECGVLHGHSSHLICTACSGNDKIHHVFDSFEGLSDSTENDVPEYDASFTWKKGDLSIPLKTVQHNLCQFESVKFYKGWIPTQFAEVADRQFCFVHVDVDLYEPTRDSLEFFYDRLVTGGVMLCDDYGYTTCPGAQGVRRTRIR